MPKMKLTEILKESNEITEAPLGMLKRAGLGLASKFSSKAAGQLATGNEANEIRKDYDFYLGSTSQTATSKSLMRFLQKEKHPVNIAQSVISKIPGIQQNPQMPLPKNVIDQIFNSIAVAQTRKSMPSSSKQTAQSTGQSQAAQTSANQPKANVNQIKTMVSNLNRFDKQALIDYLKQNDRLKELKF